MCMQKERKIVDVSGQSHTIDCLSCALSNGGVEVRGGSVVRSKYFDVHQDFEIPIPGFMILTCLRHVLSVDEFTQDEREDFMEVLCDTRTMLRKVLDINVVYLHQEEDTSHHFHMWIFPRHDWMSEYGRKVQSMRPIMEYARENLKTKENLATLDDDIKKLQLAAKELGY